MSIRLTIAEIADLVICAGLELKRPPEKEDEETEIVISECPAEGVEDEDGEAHYHAHVAYLDGCADEGCMPLGSELEKPKDQPLTTPEQRLSALLVEALGSGHEALKDLAYLIFARKERDRLHELHLESLLVEKPEPESELKVVARRICNVLDDGTHLLSGSGMHWYLKKVLDEGEKK